MPQFSAQLFKPLKADRRSTFDLFLRLMGAVYFFAFLSLFMQMPGLFGENGILPVAHYLQALKAADGPLACAACPTIFWLFLNESGRGLLSIDAALGGVCLAGIVLAIFLMAGLGRVYCSVLLYLFYLSITSVGQDFLSYQWDMLLLQAGFLAIVAALLRPLSYEKGINSLLFAWATFLFMWLDFRLIYSSGACKLVSEDPTWANFTALTYHFSTQPLPTPLAVLANAMPLWLSKGICFATLFIEIVVPFLLFAFGRLRLVAIALLSGLQLAILLTGNYCFFNWLTIFLYVPLLDDHFWRGLKERLPGLAFIRLPTPENITGGGGALVRKIAAAALMLLCTFNCAVDLGGQRLISVLPKPLLILRAMSSTCGIANGYGLFAVMTVERPEIIIEGSTDGRVYKPYLFKYKVSRPEQSPPIVAPLQPRLDWQMWFEGLNATGGDFARTGKINPVPSPWFIKFLAHLASGDKAVLALLAANPFTDAPPRYLRARIVNYTLNKPGEVLSSGKWWRTEDLGMYFDANNPPLP